MTTVNRFRFSETQLTNTGFTTKDGDTIHADRLAKWGYKPPCRACDDRAKCKNYDDPSLTIRFCYKLGYW